MPRPAWTGSISFGLVNVPIKLYAAIESHRVAFHELEQGTGERIRYKRIAEGSGHEVPWKNVQKGFEIGKDRFVVLTDEELEAAAPERTHTVDIEQFVPLDEIDPVTWNQGYYVAPDGPGAAKAYVLLRDAMRKEERVAIGRFVMRTKGYVVCIRPLEDALALHTMFFADEVRDAKDVVKLPRSASTSSRELALAAKLVASLAGSWDPQSYQDTFKRSVLELVKKKEHGAIIETAGARPAAIPDLMEALKATLAETRRPPSVRARTGAARAVRRAATGRQPRATRRRASPRRP
jgi:DNA end-binding protein Ku